MPDLLAHPPRVVADGAAERSSGQLQAVEQLGATGRRPAGQLAEVVEQALAGQGVVQGDAAGQVADPPPDLDAVADDVPAQDRRGPGRRVEIAEQQPDRGRLARAVRAEEPEDLALADADRQVVEGPDVAPGARPSAGSMDRRLPVAVPLRQAGGRQGVHRAEGYTTVRASGPRRLDAPEPSRGADHAEDRARPAGRAAQQPAVLEGRGGERVRLPGGPDRRCAGARAPSRAGSGRRRGRCSRTSVHSCARPASTTATW